jgi:hypothetical protein
MRAVNRASPATPALPEATEQTDDPDRYYHVVWRSKRLAGRERRSFGRRGPARTPASSQCGSSPQAWAAAHHEQSRRAKRPRRRGDQATRENAALSLSVEIRPGTATGMPENAAHSTSSRGNPASSLMIAFAFRPAQTAPMLWRPSAAAASPAPASAWPRTRSPARRPDGRVPWRRSELA